MTTDSALDATPGVIPYVVVWGPVSWEIPADRNMHVSVHPEGDYLAQAAAMILPPGGSAWSSGSPPTT